MSISDGDLDLFYREVFSPLFWQSKSRKPCRSTSVWTMSVRRVLSFSSLCMSAVLAKPLRITNENNLSPSPSNLIDLAFGSNVSNGTTDTEPSANFNVQCDGDLYGFNPNIADCERAAQSIIPDRQQIVWGERHAGLPFEIFPLPFAVFGGKYVTVNANVEPRTPSVSLVIDIPMC